MAENEEDYLRQCLERNICPVCQQMMIKKFGSGQFKRRRVLFVELPRKMDKALLIRRHQDRVQKSKFDE